MQPTDARRLDAAGKWQRIWVVVLNLSEGGLRLTWRSTLAVGDYLDLTYPSETGDGLLHVRADVVWVEPLPGMRCQAGCRFHHPEGALGTRALDSIA